MEHNHTHHNNSHTENRTLSYSLKDFAPLIIIFAAIILATWFLVWRLGSYDIAAVFRNFMGVFFLVFGAFKVVNLKGFANAYQIYDVIAIRSRLYAYIYPFIELVLGAAYIFSFNLLVTNWVTLVIMLISAYGVWQKLRQKEVVPCACLGAVFKIPMTYVTLGEDLLMAAMALVMILI